MMDPQGNDNDVRRLREAFASLAHNERPVEGCSQPEKIWLAVRGELSPGEVRDLVDHTASCPVCAEAWRLAREMNTQGPPAAKVEGARIERPAVGRWTAWRWGSLVAAAAVVMLVTVLSIQFDESPMNLPGTPGVESSPYRQGGEASIRPLVSADHPLPRDHFELKWSPGPPGTRYQLKIATVDLVVILEARGLEEAAYQVDKRTLQPFSSGTRFIWQVEVAHPDGTRQTSDTFVSVLQ